MFGLSFGEILVIMVVALLVLGPERLPKVARSLGKGLRDLRRTTGSFREILEEEIYLDETEKRPVIREAGPEEGGAVPRGPALGPHAGKEPETEAAPAGEEAAAGDVAPAAEATRAEAEDAKP